MAGSGGVPADSVPELEDLPGLKPVRDRLGEWLAVAMAERARAEIGMPISRPA